MLSRIPFLKSNIFFRRKYLVLSSQCLTKPKRSYFSFKKVLGCICARLVYCCRNCLNPLFLSSGLAVKTSLVVYSFVNDCKSQPANLTAYQCVSLGHPFVFHPSIRFCSLFFCAEFPRGLNKALNRFFQTIFLIWGDNTLNTYFFLLSPYFKNKSAATLLKYTKNWKVLLKLSSKLMPRFKLIHLIFCLYF